VPKTTTPYRSLLSSVLADPYEAASYLTEALAESPEMFKKALRNVAQANHFARVAKEAGVARESLYRAFSGEGNPTLKTLIAVLTSMGLKLAIEPQIDMSDAQPIGQGAQTLALSSDRTSRNVMPPNPGLRKADLHLVWSKPIHSPIAKLGGQQQELPEKIGA
jgi:probable addiction module antidote protein